MNLNFDTGVKSYNVNGVEGVFAINPTDADFVERLFDAFEDLEKRQREKESTVSKTGDKREAFRIAREYDSEMREIIDGLLGDGVSEKLFGRMNVYAYGNGLPAWANFILGLMEECDCAFAREQKATNPRLKKYLDKYRK
jgi:hypothetical protein